MKKEARQARSLLVDFCSQCRKGGMVVLTRPYNEYTSQYTAAAVAPPKITVFFIPVVYHIFIADSHVYGRVKNQDDTLDVLLSLSRNNIE